MVQWSDHHRKGMALDRSWVWCVRNALMTLDFAFTIMHYVILYHFMVMLSSCDPLSCHAFDFCVLQVIINFLAASAG